VRISSGSRQGEDALTFCAGVTIGGMYQPSMDDLHPLRSHVAALWRGASSARGPRIGGNIANDHLSVNGPPP